MVDEPPRGWRRRGWGEVPGKQCCGVAGGLTRSDAEGQQCGGQQHWIFGSAERNTVPTDDAPREALVVVGVTAERPAQPCSTRELLRDRERHHPGRAAEHCRNPYHHHVPTGPASCACTECGSEHPEGDEDHPGQDQDADPGEPPGHHGGGQGEHGDNADRRNAEQMAEAAAREHHPRQRAPADDGERDEGDHDLPAREHERRGRGHGVSVVAWGTAGRSLCRAAQAASSLTPQALIHPLDWASLRREPRL